MNAPMEDILSDLDCPICDEERLQWAAEVRGLRRKIQEYAAQLQENMKAMDETSKVMKEATTTINFLNAENQVLTRSLRNKQ
jgi:hypothetical protein